MKVRVPKDERPPSRFDAFSVDGDRLFEVGGKFKVTGKYRAPLYLEYYWIHEWQAVTQAGDISGPDGNFTDRQPYVILEKIA